MLLNTGAKTENKRGDRVVFGLEGRANMRKPSSRGRTARINGECDWLTSSGSNFRRYMEEH